MAVEFIIEDGTGVADANSYQSLIDARQVAENFGLTLPTDDEQAKVALIKGAAFLERYRYKGKALTDTQGLAFPRAMLYVNCKLVPSNSIPKQILQAQVFAAAYSVEGDLRGTSDGREVASEKLDVLQVDYFKNGKSNAVIVAPEITDRLRDYIISNSYSVRV